MKMTVKDQESLKERARFLDTAPGELALGQIDGLGGADPCKAVLLSFYELTPAADKYVIKTPLVSMTSQETFQILGCLNRPNGIDLVLVFPNIDFADLEVTFFNTSGFDPFFSELASLTGEQKGRFIAQTFEISGGHRLQGGDQEGEVRVISVVEDATTPNQLNMIVEPVGDYSTYTLRVDFEGEGTVDPIFGEIDFKFRPSCFNNCPPDRKPPPAPKQNPPIDYLAKDYDSFRHTMMSWMSSHVPDWEPTSEGDLDQVILELFSVAADELSDYQDRVMNEAYLGTARKRVSLARHGILMDYYIHQGNQASTWIALKVNTNLELGKGFEVWTGDQTRDQDSVVFSCHEKAGGYPKYSLDRLLNQAGLYTWSDATPALAAGATQADIQLEFTGEASAKVARDLIRHGKITHLLIEEKLNPLTGGTTDRNPDKRQLLEIIKGDKGAEAHQDPVTGDWFVRVFWREEDRLKEQYCFTVYLENTKEQVDGISAFHGNLIRVCHGSEMKVIFKEPGELLAEVIHPGEVSELHFERPGAIGKGRLKKCSAICRLPGYDLAYRSTPPGGEVAPRSTVTLKVNGDEWNEVASFIHSDSSAEKGDHFLVETDELGRSAIVFGDGTNGIRLPDQAEVSCSYQVGKGLDGNIGLDALINFETDDFPEVDDVWNPFDVTDGRGPEPREEIIRRVPQAYRHRQLRAVTLKDYIDRAEELAGVSRAAAQYRWTGSWRTVRVTIDPVGTAKLDEDLYEKVYQHLDAVRLIGEDLEIRPPRFVPLDILLSLCVDSAYWPMDIQDLLEEEFSERYTSDGRRGFFHPDLWTFGQTIKASQIIHRAQEIKGVDHVIEVIVKRWNEVSPGDGKTIALRSNEIIQVRNNPDHMEEGFIKLELKGGRQ